MIYMGSKERFSSSIVPILQKTINDNNIDTYIEPFCGSCAIIDKINCKNRWAYDRSDTLIALLTQMRDDFDKVLKDGNRELWDKGKGYVKDGIMPEDMSLADIGAMEFFGSFSNGGFPRGYAKNAKGRNYYNEAYKNAENQAPKLKGIKFGSQNYWELDPETKDAVIYCFDKETEILTQNGWKPIKRVNIKKDLFFSREPNNRRMDYLKATHFTHYHYTGKMCHYAGRQVDFRVTPDHKIFHMLKYGRTREKLEGFMAAEEFSKKNRNYTFVKGGGLWVGYNPNYLVIGGQKIEFIGLAKLLGIFLTNGYVDTQDRITIIPNNAEGLENLLNNLNMNFKSWEENPELGLKIYYLDEKYLPFFKPFSFKCIPIGFKNAAKVAIESLIEGVLEGAGDKKKQKIAVRSKLLRDDIQECLFKIGYGSNYVIEQDKDTGNEYYIVTLTTSHYPNFNRDNIIWEDYDDEVYCVTLEKWHTVLVRRNGKTVWLGQCDPPYQNTKFYGYANQGKMDYEHFWNWIRKLSKDNYVYISEQTAPEDFEVVWEQECKRTCGKDNNFKAVEKLFRWKDGLK